MEKIKGGLAVLIGAASYGVLSTFVKMAYQQGMTLASVTGTQALFGMIFLWGLFFLILLIKPSLFKNYSRKSSWKTALIAGGSSGLISILYYKCVQLVPASLAIILLMQYIWISVLIELVIFKNKPNKRDLIAIAFVLLATIPATGLLEKPTSSFSFPGLLYGLGAATAYASFLIINGKVAVDYPPVLKSALLISGSFILIAILLPQTYLLETGITPVMLHYGCIIALFGTIIPPLLFAYGIPKVGTPATSILSSAELPMATCMAFFVLHESVSWIQWTGILGVILVIIWKNLSKTTK